MTPTLFRRWTIALLAFILLLVSSACTPAAGVPPQNTPLSNAVGNTPERPPLPNGVGTLEASATPAGTSVPTKIVFGPGTFNFLEPTAGLVGLSSYKAALRMSFNGTEDGQPSQWSQTYVMRYTKEPAARSLTIEKTGNISDLTPVFKAEAEGAAYQRRGENLCTATVIDQALSFAIRQEPARFLNNVIGAQAAGSETVNGVTADHYIFDECAFGQPGLAKASGEMWVATGGGYLVKYVLTIQGKADYFGEGMEGSLTWDYELTGANQPVAIQLPADCPAGMVNAPLVPGATNILRVPSLLTYQTATSVADAGAFYQKQIPALGWAPLGNPVISNSTVWLDYSLGGKKMTIFITSGDGGTKVRVLLGKT